MHRLRTHTQESTERKMFCVFIALIVSMYIENNLGKWMKDNRMTMDRAIRELVKIRCVEGLDGKCLLNPLTKKQREIIEGIGASVDDIKNFFILEVSSLYSG